MVRATLFTDPAAVDAWDNWFRWRDAGCLHDRTIDATWRRVGNAIVPQQDPEGQRWAQRYVDAFSRWQLLPDERLLRMAGTGTGMVTLESPCAALNVAAFVIAPRSRQARFDDEHFAHIAALAVRMLDDALLTMHCVPSHPVALRIGLIGFADSLHLLDIDYDDPRAVQHADAIGTILAAGTLQGTLELTAERAPLGCASTRLLACWRERGVPDALVQAAARNGVRHSQLTAVEAQPCLALLANNASDALDPRTAPRPGTLAPETACQAMATARLAIRSAIQPWIDAPIGCSLATLGEPVANAIESIAR